MKHYPIATLALVGILVLAGCTSAGGVTTTSPETTTPTSGAEPQSQTTTATSPAESTASVPATVPGGETRTATVVDVTDGDTVDVRFANGTAQTVRLLGVDTPETAERYMDPSEYGIPDTPAGRDWLLQWGTNAKEFATQRLAGEQVTVVFDPQSERRGYFGRLLAYIYYDNGQNFGKELLQRGLARVYTGGEFTREDEYLAIEADVQAAHKGLWGFESVTTPTPTTTAPTTATPVSDGGGSTSCS